MNKLNQGLRLLLFAFLICSICQVSFAEEEYYAPVSETNFSGANFAIPLPQTPPVAATGNSAPSATVPSIPQAPTGGTNTFQATDTIQPYANIPQPPVETFSQTNTNIDSGNVSGTTLLPLPDAPPIPAIPGAGPSGQTTTPTTTGPAITVPSAPAATGTVSAPAATTPSTTTPGAITPGTTATIPGAVTPGATIPGAATPGTTASTPSVFSGTDRETSDELEVPTDEEAITRDEASQDGAPTASTTGPGRGSNLPVNASSFAQVAIIHAGCNANTCSGCNTTNIFPANVGGSPLGACCRQNPNNPGCI